jgi:hypothetical protein
MDTHHILQALDRLPLADLRRIQHRLADLIATMEGWQEPEQNHTGGTVREEFVRCGKAGCTVCAEGPGHGPYLYRYSRQAGKLKKQYLGKQRPQ